MVLVTDPVKNLGQYFTPKILAEFIVNLLAKKDPRILEPAAGSGIIVEALEKKYADIVAIEIDSNLKSVTNYPIQYLNFFDYPIQEKFDVVIGNPPYVRWRNQPHAVRKDIIKRKFWNNRINALADMLQAFIFKSIDHLREGGELLFITPKFWLQTLHAANLREFILEQGYLDLIIDFNEKKLFSSVSSNLIIFKFIKSKLPPNHQIQVFTFLEKEVIVPEELTFILEKYKTSMTATTDVSHPTLKYHLANHPTTSHGWTFYAATDEQIITTIETSCQTHYTVEVVLEQKSGAERLHVPLVICLSPEQLKLYAIPKKLLTTCSLGDTKRYVATKLHGEQKDFIESRFVTIADICKIGNGMVSGLDKAFVLPTTMTNQSSTFFTTLERSFLRKVVKARYMNQYKSFTYATYIFIEEDNFSSEAEFKEQCPNLYNHLLPYKEELLQRWSPKPVPWYVWSFPRNQAIFQSFEHKFYLPCKERFDNKGFIRCVYEQDHILGVQDITVLGLYPWIKESPEYLLAYLNSDSLFQWLKIKGLKRGGVLQFSEHPLSMIPVRLINWLDPNEVKLHTAIKEQINLLLTSERKEDVEIYKQHIEELFRKLI